MWAWNKVELKTWKVFNVCTTLKSSVWRTALRDLENTKIWLFFCTWIFQATKELRANSSPEAQIQVSPGQEFLQKNTLNFNCYFPLPFSLLSQLFRSLPHFGVKKCLHCSFLNIPQPLILLLCSRSLYNELRNSRSFSLNNQSLVNGGLPIPLILYLQPAKHGDFQSHNELKPPRFFIVLLLIVPKWMEHSAECWL